MEYSRLLQDDLLDEWEVCSYAMSNLYCQQPRIINNAPGLDTYNWVTRIYPITSMLNEPIPNSTFEHAAMIKCEVSIKHVNM